MNEHDYQRGICDAEGCAGDCKASTKQLTKNSLLKRRARLAHEIEQIFIDAEHWNDHVRKSSEAPIDPDPDGALKRLLENLRKEA